MESSLQTSQSQRIAELEQTIEALNEELASTNTGVVALYAELEDKAQELAQAIELKSRFLSYMSHEFKTPLSSILSIGRILADELDGPLSSEQKQQVDFIRGAATELSEIVNDLLDLAKIDAGKVQVSKAWFSMVHLFSALRGMFGPLLLTDCIHLIFEEPTEDIKLFTDNRMVSQVLRNFISNAIKFTPAGEIRVSAILDGDFVEFAVVDTGIGIPERHLKAIFEDFVQVQSTLQRRYKGTGLGLALSKKISELLGGSVRVESVEGKGSTFFLRIPTNYPEEESVQES